MQIGGLLYILKGGEQVSRMFKSYPVVTSLETMAFVGTVSRKDLVRQRTLKRRASMLPTTEHSFVDVCPTPCEIVSPHGPLVLPRLHRISIFRMRWLTKGVSVSIGRGAPFSALFA